MSGPPKRGRRIGSQCASSFIALGATSSGSTSSVQKRADVPTDDAIRKRDFTSAFSTSSLSDSGPDSKSSKISENEASKLASQIMKYSQEKDMTSLMSRLSDAIKYVSTNRVSPNGTLYVSVLNAFKLNSSTNLLESYPKLMKLVLDILVSAGLNCSITVNCTCPVVVCFRKILLGALLLLLSNVRVTLPWLYLAISCCSPFVLRPNPGPSSS